MGGTSIIRYKREKNERPPCITHFHFIKLSSDRKTSKNWSPDGCVYIHSDSTLVRLGGP